MKGKLLLPLLCLSITLCGCSTSADLNSTTETLAPFVGEVNDTTSPATSITVASIIPQTPPPDTWTPISIEEAELQDDLMYKLIEPGMEVLNTGANLLDWADCLEQNTPSRLQIVTYQTSNHQIAPTAVACAWLVCDGQYGFYYSYRKTEQGFCREDPPVIVTRLWGDFNAAGTSYYVETAQGETLCVLDQTFYPDAK